MSVDHYADWFKKYVAEKFLDTAPAKPAPEPQPAPKKPEAKLQAPVETKPEAKPDKTNFSQRMSDELDAQVEFERHPDLFDDSEGGWENVQLVLDSIKTEHDGYPSRRSVADAIQTLRRRGELLTLFRPEPSPAPKPIVVQHRTQSDHVAQPVVAQTEAESLPELSPWVWAKLGSNKMLTRQDVKSIPSGLYSELYRNNKYGPEFQARVNAVLNLR